jgi:hypothetical protein
VLHGQSDRFDAVEVIPVWLLQSVYFAGKERPAPKALRLGSRERFRRFPESNLNI